MFDEWSVIPSILVNSIRWVLQRKTHTPFYKYPFSIRKYCTTSSVNIRPRQTPVTAKKNNKTTTILKTGGK